ncbi:tetraspanin, putative [Schistosoma mansoni]|uniref:tetraspanin, putative n=1 Tax=Schistosoma mansoni TaxID=6183 RepID=UPI00019B38CE|nr:tetraspanin, putative [Schistosoma mansoni]|eukprot:XP_018646773.1 tetraspanin, putative [Schistosoma mansoni]
MGPHLLRISAYSTISIGGVILLLSILGCAGAALENRCILVTFFTLLCGLFMACLVIGTLTTVFRRDLKCCAVEDNQADLYLRSVWYSRQIHQSSVFGTNSIRLLSQEHDNNLGIPSVVNVPVSCCVYSLETKEFSNRTACQIGSLKSNLNPYLNPHGCANVIIALLYQYFIPLIIMVVILAVLMMAGLILGLLLLRSFSVDDYPEINLRENV